MGTDDISKQRIKIVRDAILKKGLERKQTELPVTDVLMSTKIFSYDLADNISSFNRGFKIDLFNFTDETLRDITKVLLGESNELVIKLKDQIDQIGGRIQRKKVTRKKSRKTLTTKNSKKKLQKKTKKKLLNVIMVF